MADKPDPNQENFDKLRKDLPKKTGDAVQRMVEDVFKNIRPLPSRGGK